MAIRLRFVRPLGVFVAAVALSACAANITVEAPVQTDGTGPPATALAMVAGQQAGCVVERGNVEVALEGYYAFNGADPVSLDDLVPTFLKESVSPRWSMQPNPAGGAPIITGLGVCEGA